MALRIRILLWVSSLFLTAIVFIFVISHYEINSHLEKGEKELVKKVKQVDLKNEENILQYLSLAINNDAEKMYSVFDMMKTSPQWRLRFLPDDYNMRTKSWGSSAAILSTYPWIDFINVQINDELGSFIRQAQPFLNKYVKIPAGEDLILFTTKKKDGNFGVYIGVPFWGNQSILKYVKDAEFQDFFLSKQPDQWLLYEVNELLNLDAESLHPAKNKIYKHIFDEAITVHSEEEYEFLIESTKTMIEVTKKKVKSNPELIDTLQNTAKRDQFIKRQLKIINPNISYERNFCVGPLCKYEIKERPERAWSTRRNFAHKYTQQKMIWELCMLIRTGMWDFSPFSKGMPIGIVTDLSVTKAGEERFFNDVAEGFFINDVFIDKTILTQRKCRLETQNPEYDKKIIFKGGQKGVAKSCRNHDLTIFYDREIKEPFLTSTSYITYLKAPMKKPNEAAITVGIALDPILIDLALVSPNAVAFLYGEGDLRFYTTDGKVKNIVNNNDANRLKLINQTEGSLIDEEGHKLYFKRLGNITSKGGSIIIIEKEESRTAIIDSINNHVSSLMRKMTVNSSILILIALVTILSILLRVIKTITNPINRLATLTGSISDGKLKDVELKEKYINRKDEIGTLYSSFNSMIKSMKEGEKVRGLLDKVVSKQVAEKILNEGVELGGELRTLTVMFCDIRNFTSITEKMNPEDVIIMLNECLTLLSAVIDDFEGVIDKYEGDKIMTLFGAPITIDDHALQATLCAIEMQNALNIWNLSREANGYCKLEVGIGIHTGEAVAGNVGAENHLSYTVLGHIVNLSARLCDGAKAQEILITKETLESIKDYVEVRENPPHKFKGISQPVVTYSVIRKK